MFYVVKSVEKGDSSNVLYPHSIISIFTAHIYSSETTRQNSNKCVSAAKINPLTYSCNLVLKYKIIFGQIRSTTSA